MTYIWIQHIKGSFVITCKLQQQQKCEQKGNYNNGIIHMIHSNESNQAFCFPLLTFSNSSSASFNWLCNADTLRSNRSTWSVLHNGLYGSVKFLENDLRASTPVTCQFAILIKGWYKHNSFSCSVFVSCRVDTRTFNLKCRCYRDWKHNNLPLLEEVAA